MVGVDSESETVLLHGDLVSSRHAVEVPLDDLC